MAWRFSSAVRSAQRIEKRHASRFFMPGQGLGSWQTLAVEAGRGTAKVNQSSGAYWEA